MKTQEDYLNLMQNTPPPGAEVGAVVNAAVYTPPDQAAEFRRRAEQTGVPYEVVKRAGALPPVKPQVDYTKLMQDAPKTATWLLDPGNAAVAQDDIETLRGIEQATQEIGPFKRAAQLTADPIRAAAAGLWALPGQMLSGFGELAGATARSQQRFFKNVVGVDLPYRLFDPLNSASILKYVGSAPKDFAQQVVAPPQERENLATSIFGAAGQMVGQAALTVAAPQAALPAFFAMGADQMGEEAEQAGKAGEAGSDTAVVLGGAFTAVTEKLAIQNILNRLPPKIKTRALRYATDLSLAVGFEAVQEGAEQVWQNLLVQSLIDEQRELLDGVVEGAAVGGGAAGLVRGVLLGLAPGRLKYNEKTNAAADALRETGTLERAVELTQKSNLAQRSPEAFDQLVSTFTAQGIDQVGIPLEVVRSYAQSKGIPGAQLAQELGVTQASFVEAEMTGGDLRVPTAAFLRSTHAGSLTKDVRTRATGMTANEANEWSKTEAGEELRQLLEETKTQMDSSKDSSIKVYDDLYLKFKAAGRSESQAQMLAEVGRRQASARAAKFDRDAWEMYSENPIQIGTVELAKGDEVKKTFEQTDFDVDRTFFQRTTPAPVIGEVVGGFYSDLERKLSTLLPKKGTAAQYREVVQNLIKAQKIKKEEALDTGLLGILDATADEINRPVASQAVYNREDVIQSWVATSRPDIVVQNSRTLAEAVGGQEVYKVADVATGITIGVFNSYVEAEQFAAQRAAPTEVYSEDVEVNSFQHMVLPGAAFDYQEWTLSFGPDSPSYGEFSEMHFGPPNTFAHIRTDQRETPDGKPVLFINELQSDWVSIGARRGFVGDPPIDTSDWVARPRGRSSESSTPVWSVQYSKNRTMPIAASTAEAAIWKVANALERQRIPRPPKFVQGWQNLALRQMLKHAIDNGMEYMAWPATAEQVQQIEQWGDQYSNDRVVRNYTSDIPKALNNYLGRFGVKTEQIELAQTPGERSYSVFKNTADNTYFISPVGFEADLVLGFVTREEAQRAADGMKQKLTGQLVNAVRITPEMRQVLGAGQPYYQKIDDVPRGLSQFGSQGERYMALLKDANRSTAIHEFGHIWLEELRADAARKDAPQQLKDDWKTIKKWLDIKSGAPSREQHELFARGTERYFMEGKSPSTALRRVFRSFKRWLLDIYRHANALNAPINDDVRAVFDRLLATADEIKEAREDTEQRPLFTTAKDMGISEELFEAYRKSIQDTIDEQEEKLAAEAMEDVTRETKDWWQEQSAAMREQVADTLSKSKLYSAVSWLRTGKLPDQSTLDIPAARLDGDTIADAEVREKLRRMGLVASKAGTGVSTEDVAPLFGYANGDELVADLQTAVPFKQAVQQAVEAEMRARHGDFITNLDERADQALQAVHDDASGALLRAEVAALHRLHRQSAPARRVVREEERKEAKEKLAAKDEKIAALRNSLDQAKKEGAYRLRWSKAEQAQRLQQERDEADGAMDLPPLEAFRNMARGMVSQQRVRDINPLAYLQAERKAGKAAYKAALNKEYRVAATAKMRQLLNHYLYLEAVKAEDIANGLLKRTQRLQKKATQERWGKVGGNYLGVLNDLLEQYEFVRVSNKNLTRRENLRAWLVQQESEGATITIPDSVLDDARRTNYRELTLDQLRAVNDTITSLEHQVRLKGKLLQGRQQADYESTVEELLRSLAENFNSENPPPIDAETLSRMDRIKRGLQNADSTLLKTEQLLRWIDGDQPAGAWFRTIFEPIARAQSAELDLLTDFGDVFAGLFSKYYDGRGRDTLLKVESFPELGGVKLTRQALIAMALNTGTDSNYTKLKEGYDWTDVQINQALNRLTKEDWQFVQEAWNMLESMWPHIAGLEKRLTGLEPKRLGRRTVQTPFGTLAGGYYPIVYSPDQPGTSKIEADSLFGPNYVRATTDQGHTKERTTFVGKVQLNLEVIPQHMAQVVHDITHREAVININRLLGDKRIQTAIANRVGAPYVSMLNGWLRNVANDRSQDNTGNKWWLRYAAKLRVNASVVAMGFKATTMLAQLSGVVQAMEQVRVRNFASAMAEFLRSPVASTKAVQQLSGEMRNRNQSLERDVRDVYNAQLGKTGFISAVHRNAFKGIALFDAFVTIPTWKAAFADAKDRKLSDEDAIMWADSVVRLTASAGGAKDQVAVQRANEFMKWGTLFYSYFSVLYARLRSLGHVNKVGPEKYATIAWRSMLVWIVPAMLGELLAFRGPDEEEEEGAAEWAFKKVALYPVMTLPFVRDLATTFDFGFESRTPLGALFNSIYRSATGVGPALEGEKEFIDLFKPAMSSAGYIVGLPAAQINITAEYLWDIYTGEEDPESVSEFIRNLFIRREE